MRLIDADALKEHISSFAGMFTDEGFLVDLTAVLAAIDYAPTIESKRQATKTSDAEPKRGRWIWDNRFHDYTCSECNNWDLKTPNFCSNCGADMREVNNATD